MGGFLWPSKNISVPVVYHPYPSGAGECVSVTSKDWAASTDTHSLLHIVYVSYKFSF